MKYLLKCVFGLSYFSFVFCILLTSSGCKKHSPVLTDSAQLGVIRIGEVGSMTGSDATFGISTHRGILLAVSEVNSSGGIRGHKLELITVDDQGRPSEAVLAMNKLISQQKVQAVLGEVASTLSIAMGPIAQQFKIPMITPSSINSRVTQQGDYVFRVCFVDKFQSKVMADFALNQLHAKKAAILRDVKSDYSQDSSQIFTDLFKKGGGEIVMDQSYGAGDIDFKSQLTAIRATNPDVILVPGYYTEIGLIARQSQELGIKAPLLGGDGWDSPKLKEIGGEALAGSYFVSHFSQENPDPVTKKFVESYKSTFGGESPDGLAALGYDAARVLADALKRAPTASALDLKRAIGLTQKFPGVTGLISMGADRNAVKPAIVFKLDEGGEGKFLTLIQP